VDFETLSYLQNCHHHHLSSLLSVSRRDGVCTPANVGDGIPSSGKPRAAPPSKPVFAPSVFAQNRPLAPRASATRPCSPRRRTPSPCSAAAPLSHRCSSRPHPLPSQFEFLLFPSSRKCQGPSSSPPLPRAGVAGAMAASLRAHRGAPTPGRPPSKSATLPSSPRSQEAPRPEPASNPPPERCHHRAPPPSAACSRGAAASGRPSPNRDHPQVALASLVLPHPFLAAGKHPIAGIELPSASPVSVHVRDPRQQ